MTHAAPLPSKGDFTPTRTVLVLGASYGGQRAAQTLISVLPSNWRVVVLERNSHFNHLYAFPRMSVLPGHEHKIFVPYSRLFQPQDVVVTSSNNVVLHGNLDSLTPSTSQDGKPAVGRGLARYTPLHATEGQSVDWSKKEEVAFDYLVYALGSKLPAPIDLWSAPAKKTMVPPVDNVETVDGMVHVNDPDFQPRGSKPEGIKWIQQAQEQIKDAESVLVIGAGALGVRE
jgi:NADH dehydrogenase FAD-containing subunit